jgi:Ser/Thr protein kinase RdoA (MazF antagonist)
MGEWCHTNATYDAAMVTWRDTTHEQQVRNRKARDKYNKIVRELTENEEKALGLISMKLSPSLIHLIKDTARATWLTLKSEFRTIGAAGVYLDWMKLKEFQMTPNRDLSVQIGQLR